MLGNEERPYSHTCQVYRHPLQLSDALRAATVEHVVHLSKDYNTQPRFLQQVTQISSFVSSYVLQLCDFFEKDKAAIIDESAEAWVDNVHSKEEAIKRLESELTNRVTKSQHKESQLEQAVASKEDQINDLKAQLKKMMKEHAAKTASLSKQLQSSENSNSSAEQQLNRLSKWQTVRCPQCKDFRDSIKKMGDEWQWQCGSCAWYTR